MEIFKNIEQGSEEWLKARAWVITWTKLKNICWSSKTQETAMYELIAEEFAPLEENFSSQAMQRWKELESIAKAKYIDKTWEKVEEIWFIKKNDYVWLSPDGVIFDENEKIKKAIEIKCPWAKNFTKCILENKIPEEYKYQVIMYFLVISDLEELDFILYNPDFYIKEKRLFIINIKRSKLEKEIYQAESQIEIFRKSWLEKIKFLLPKK